MSESVDAELMFIRERDADCALEPGYHPAGPAQDSGAVRAYDRRWLLAALYKAEAGQATLVEAVEVATSQHWEHDRNCGITHEGSVGYCTCGTAAAYDHVSELIDDLAGAVDSYKRQIIEEERIDQQLGRYLASRGLDTPDNTSGEKAKEEASELVAAIASGDMTAIRHEIADLALVAAVVARNYGVAVEDCITEKTTADLGRGGGKGEVKPVPLDSNPPRKQNDTLA